MGVSNKIAYMIMAHRDEEHLYDLINALNYKSDFYVYIDKKTDIKPFKKALDGFTNVYFIEKRRNIKWGGYRQAESAVEMMRQAKEKDTYARYVFLTGADYPTNSAKKTYEALVEEPDKEYICGINLNDCTEEMFLVKIKKRWFFEIDVNGNVVKRGIRKAIDLILKLLPDRKPYYIGKTRKYDIFYGFAYWGITDACANHILDIIKSERGLVRYIKRCYAPIELLVQTIVFNSHFADNASLCKDFAGWDAMAFAPIHFVKYGKNGSKVLTEQDYDEIRRSNKLFIMKTDSIRSDTLIKKLKQENDL